MLNLCGVMFVNIRILYTNRLSNTQDMLHQARNGPEMRKFDTLRHRSGKVQAGNDEMIDPESWKYDDPLLGDPSKLKSQFGWLAMLESNMSRLGNNRITCHMP